MSKNNLDQDGKKIGGLGKMFKKLVEIKMALKVPINFTKI